MNTPDRRFEHASRVAGVKDERVLSAMASVSRHDFVPDADDALVDVDAPVPLPCDQTTSQPSLIALMVEALNLSPRSRVLEIGTGYGYQTAILARLASHVWSIERWETLASAAQRRLRATGITNVDVLVGDGASGLPAQAPFDAIVVAAAALDVPEPLADQLAVGGRLVIPIGTPRSQHCVVLTRTRSGIEQVGDLGPVRFVPLVSGLPRERPAL